MLVSRYHNEVIEYMFDSMLKLFMEPEDLPFDKPSVFPNVQTMTACLTSICLCYPHLIIEQFKSVDFRKRFRMVTIFKKLFTLRSELGEQIPDLAADIHYRQATVDLWQEFFGRFNDAHCEMRRACIETSFFLFITQRDAHIITELQSALATILLYEQDPELRLLALDTVERVSEDFVTSLCCPNLVKAIASRCGDREERVRSLALTVAAQLFVRMAQINDPSIIKLNHVFKLSSACLVLYKKQKSANDDYDIEKGRCDIERVFERNFTNAFTNSVAVKARNLLNLVCYCTGDAVKSIAQLLYSESWMRRQVLDLLNFVSSRDNTSLASERATRKLLAKLVKYYPCKDALRLLDRVLVLEMIENRDLLESLKQLLEPSHTMAHSEILDIVVKFVDSDGSDSGGSQDADERAMRELIILRCGAFIIDLETIEAMLMQMKTFDVSYALRLASFIALLSNLYGTHFERESVEAALLQLPAPILGALHNKSVTPLLYLRDKVMLQIKDTLLAYYDEEMSESLMDTQESTQESDKTPSPIANNSEVMDETRVEGHLDFGPQPQTSTPTATPANPFISRHIVEGLLRFMR